MYRIAGALLFLIFHGICKASGSQKPDIVEGCERAEQFGLQYRWMVPDDNFTSSSFKPGFPAHYGRLGYIAKAWCASIKDTMQWLQIDFGAGKELLAVTVEGLTHAWVTQFYLQYSVDNRAWYCFGYEGSQAKLMKSFKGSYTHLLLTRPVARYVRINPQAWNNSICLKAEIYGCHDVVSKFSYPRPIGASCDEFITTEPPTTQITTDTPATVPPVAIGDLQIRLSGLSDGNVVSTGKIFMASLWMHIGTQITYVWNMEPFLHNYNSSDSKPTPVVAYTPGEYIISVFASNQISNASAQKEITVQDPISGLRLTRNIPPTTPRTDFIVSWTIQTGTDVSFSVEFPNGGPKLKQFSVASSHDIKTPKSMNNSYSQPGVFSFTITATNRLPGPSRLTVMVTVENPLVSLSVDWKISRPLVPGRNVTYLSTGENLLVQAKVTSGTNPFYQFDFGDKSMGNLSNGNITYAFEQPGIYSVIVTAFNNINKLTYRIATQFIIQTGERIKGLVVFATPTPLGRMTSIYLERTSGSAYTCEWSLGDNSNAMTGVKDFNVSYIYTRIGTYEVSVCCQNVYGSICAKTNAHVDVPVKGLAIMANASLVTTNSTVLFDIVISNGSRVSYQLEVFEGITTMQFPATRGNKNTYHFTRPGRFDITAISRNSLGEVKSNRIVVLVQIPLFGLRLKSNSPVKWTTGVVTFRVQIPSKYPIPTNVSCSWKLGDGTVIKKPLKVNQAGEQAFTYKYLNHSHFTVYINCSNLVSHSAMNTSVLVHRIITPQVNIYRSGLALALKFIATNESANACVTLQEGDKSYRWFDIYESDKSILSKNPCSTYNFRSAGKYNIRVLVNNILENMTANVQIDVEDKITRINISAKGECFVRSNCRFYWSAERFGTNPKFELKFSDGSPIAVFCNNTCIDSASNFIEGTNIYDKSFQNVGSYDVLMIGHNMVSKVSSSTRVSVIKYTCKLDEVTILKGNATEDSYEIKKKEGLKLWISFSYTCKIAQNVLVEYNIENSRTQTSVKHTENGALTLTKEQLDYGPMQIEAVVTIDVAADIRDIYGIIQKSKSVTINVTASQLIATITCESCREVDLTNRFSLSAETSRDPDDDYAYLMYEWYCRIKDSGDGCTKANGADVLLSRMKVFENYNELDDSVRNKTLIYKLVVETNDKRRSETEHLVRVRPAGAPKILIRRADESKPKLMYLKHLKLESDCSDCTQDEMLDYLWSVYRKEPSTGEHKKYDISLLQTEAGFDKRTFSLKPKTFPAVSIGERFLVELTAKRKGGKSATVKYNFEIQDNTPPKAGNCSVSPLVGEERSTKFTMECDNFMDEDLPLSYTFKYKILDQTFITYHGMENKWKFQIRLPLEMEAENATVRFLAEIKDVYGEETTKGITKVELTQVAWVTKSKPKTLDLSSLMSQMSELGGLTGSGATSGDSTSGGSASGANNGGEGNGGTNGTTAITTPRPINVVQTVQIVVMISESLNQDSLANKKAANKTGTSVGNATTTNSTNKALKISVRETLSRQIETLVLANITTSIEEVNLISDALKSVLSDPEEISSSTMSSAVNSLEILATMVRDIETTNKPNVQKAATTLIDSINSVVESKIIAKSKEGTNVQEALQRKKEIEETKKIRSAVTDVVDAYSSTLAEGEVDKISTSTLEVTFEKHDVRFIGNRTIHGKIADVYLPPSERISFNLSSTELVTLQIVEYSINLCTNSKSTLDSPCLVLGFKKEDGSPYKLSPGKEDMQVNFHHRAEQSKLKTLYKENKICPKNGSHISYLRIDWSEYEEEKIITFIPYSTKYMNWTISIRHGVRPTESDFAHSWRVSSTSNTKRHDFKLARSQSHLPRHITWHPGPYYIKVVPSLNIQQLKEWKNMTLNISFILADSSCCQCLFWEQSTDVYLPIKVGHGCSRTSIPCRTNRQASFLSRFIVAPNPIEFEKALAGFLHLSDNPVVFTTVITIFGVYLLLLIWARKRDLEDDGRNEVVILEDNHQQDRFMYEVTIFTGMRKEAGTTSDVFCVIIGDRHHTQPRALIDHRRRRFQRASVDSFLLTTPNKLGDISCIKLWHNNKGIEPSWFVNRIAIRDIQTDQLYYFLCDRWLAVEYDDGQVERTIPAAKKDDLKTFGHLFKNVSEKHITDGHLWLSVFVRPTKSTFTRVQRLSCCLALFYCTMLANAMFYQVGEEEDPALTEKFGPFSFSPKQVYIGIISSLVIFPANLIIVGIFRNIRPKGKKKLRNQVRRPTIQNAPEIHENEDMSKVMNWYRATGESQTELLGSQGSGGFAEIAQAEETTEDDFSRKHLENPDNSSPNSRRNSVSHKIDLKMNEKPGKAAKLKKKRKEKFLFPHWAVYVGWFGVLGVSATAAFFITLYGFQFGKEKASQWLASMMISFLHDVLISQPLKVLIIALFFALVLKKLDDDQETSSDQSQQAQNHISVEQSLSGATEWEFPSKKSFRQSLIVQPPNANELEKARKTRFKEIQMDHIVRELIIYVLFLGSLLVVSYTHRDPQAFYVAQLMTNTYIDGAYAGTGLKQIDGADHYWIWLENTVLPSLSSTKRSWAPRCHPQSNYSIDCTTRIVGTARLRQLRMPEGTCNIPKEMQQEVNRCNDAYSFFGESTNNYVEGWKRGNISNTTSSPWHYHSTMDLGGLPYIGLVATYNGGGYTVELRNDERTIEELKRLKEQSWIDERTRALFLEISVYNAQINLFGVATFLTEVLPTNGYLYFDNVKVARLYVTDGDLEIATLACEVFIAIFVLIFIFQEFKKIFKQKKKYFKDVWNWIEVALIVLIFGCAFAIVERSILTNFAITDMQNQPTKFVSLIQSVTIDELLTYFLGLLVFVANIKLLKLCRFNHRIFLFTKTLSTAAGPLISFLIVFFVFYFAFTSVYHLIFGHVIEDYATILSTIETLFSTLLGGFEFQSTQNEQRILGPLLFFAFTVLMVMILMNMFLAIIMDAFGEVQADENLSNEYEIVEFILQRFKRYVAGFRNDTKIGVLEEKSNEEEEALEELATRDEVSRKALQNYSKASAMEQYKSNENSAEFQQKNQPSYPVVRIENEQEEGMTEREENQDEEQHLDALDRAMLRATARARSSFASLNESSDLDRFKLQTDVMLTPNDATNLLVRKSESCASLQESIDSSHGNVKSDILDLPTKQKFGWEGLGIELEALDYSKMRASDMAGSFALLNNSLKSNQRDEPYDARYTSTGPQDLPPSKRETDLDALDYAIMKANDMEKAEQILENLFDFGRYRYHESQPKSIFERIKEKLEDMTAWFACVAMDDVIMDCCYEQMFRYYVNDLHKKALSKQFKKQLELSESWEADTILMTKPKQQPTKNIYARHLQENCD